MRNVIILLSFFSLLTGCPYPASTVMPLESQVVDADTGLPIEKAAVLRIVCDIHDFNCVNGQIDESETDKDGRIKLKGRRQWGLLVPAPGGLPVPNHQIAIWKPGYQAFVFSQYGNIDDLLLRTKREDLKKAIKKIPQNRRTYTSNDSTEKMLRGGKIELLRLAHKST